MGDVSKISLLALKNANLPKKITQDKKESDEKQDSSKLDVNHKEPDEVLAAMALTGSANIALLGLNSINPAKYLTPERIADIEKSMAVFEKGVQKNLEVINQEFGGIGADLSESYKLELAAQMMI